MGIHICITMSRAGFGTVHQEFGLVKFKHKWPCHACMLGVLGFVLGETENEVITVYEHKTICLAVHLR